MAKVVFVPFTIFTLLSLTGCNANRGVSTSSEITYADINVLIFEHTGISNKYIKPLVFFMDSIDLSDVEAVFLINNPNVPPFNKIPIDGNTLELLNKNILRHIENEDGNNLTFGSTAIFGLSGSQILFEKKISAQKESISFLREVLGIINIKNLSQEEVFYIESMLCHLQEKGWPCET